MASSRLVPAGGSGFRRATEQETTISAQSPGCAMSEAPQSRLARTDLERRAGKWLSRARISEVPAEEADAPVAPRQSASARVVGQEWLERKFVDFCADAIGSPHGVLILRLACLSKPCEPTIKGLRYKHLVDRPSFTSPSPELMFASLRPRDHTAVAHPLFLELHRGHG
jgi:hypothetical protein